MRLERAIGVILAVAVLGLLAAGCSRPASPSAAQPSIADQVVAIIKPVPGELISPPVGEEVVSPEKYLIYRLEAAAQSNPDLFKGVQPEGSPAPTGQWLWTFRDGSTMRWVPEPAPEADGIGGPLARVETGR